MGRGRQKAKQTKVARRLKYFSPETDYDALQRELANGDAVAAQGHTADGSEAAEEVDDGGSAGGDTYADWNARGRH